MTQEKAGPKQAQFHTPPQLLEFDSTTSDTAAKHPGKPYPPYSLAEFLWDNITDSLHPATLSATFRGHPKSDPTGAFANGSLAFKVSMGKEKESKGWFLLPVCFPHLLCLLLPRSRPLPTPADLLSPLVSCTQQTPAS